MSSRQIHSVSYRNYLDENVPIKKYDLYENGTHRFAFITFYNQSEDILLSFDVKLTLVNKDKEKIGEFLFTVDHLFFLPRTELAMEKPVPLPLECDAFNYEILNIVRKDVSAVKPSEDTHVNIVAKKLPCQVPSSSRRVQFFRHPMPFLFTVLATIIGVLPFFVTNLAKNGFQGGDSSLNDPSQEDLTKLSYDYDENYEFTKVYEDFEYGVKGDNATILKYKGTADYVQIPDVIQSYVVTGIAPYAFESCTMDSVEFMNGKGVEFVIYPYAFNFVDCPYFIFNNIRFISTYAFYYPTCEVKMGIQLGNGVICPKAFLGYSENSLVQVYGNGICYVDSFSCPYELNDDVEILKTSYSLMLPMDDRKERRNSSL